MVACAAVSQSQVLLAVPMTASPLSVDQLKEKLLSAVENVRNLIRGQNSEKPVRNCEPAEIMGLICLPL